MNKILAIAMSGLLITGCTSAATHRADVQDDSMDRVTVGTVQKEIYVGMSGAEVGSVLGSMQIEVVEEKRVPLIKDRHYGLTLIKSAGHLGVTD